MGFGGVNPLCAACPHLGLCGYEVSSLAARTHVVLACPSSGNYTDFPYTLSPLNLNLNLNPKHALSPKQEFRSHPGERVGYRPFWGLGFFL